MGNALLFLNIPNLVFDALLHLYAEYVGVYDARDAIEACGGLWGEEKEACYAIFGVAPQADEWYDLVFSLESVLEMDTCKFDDIVLTADLNVLNTIN